MTEQELREKFEIWVTEETGLDLYRAEYPMTKPEDQPYKDHNTLLAWLAFKAGSEAFL